MGEAVEKLRPLTAADINGAGDIRIEAVHIPEWGGTVYVRELADMDAVEYFARFSGKKEVKVDFGDMCKVAAMALCDADGNRLFDDEHGPQQLKRRKATAVVAVFNKAMELSGLTKSAIAAEKKD